MLDTFRGATKEALANIAEEMRVRRTKEVFLLMSFGSQTDHLIALELAKLGVYCLVADPASVTANDVRMLKPKGIILSGGPASVASEAPTFDTEIFKIGIPILGICLGFQMWARYIGANVQPDPKKEFGVHVFSRDVSSRLLYNTPINMRVLQSHGDRIELSPKFKVLGLCGGIVAAGSHKHLYGVQFHPEVSHTEYGAQIFENFCFKICKAKDRFKAQAAGRRKTRELRAKIGTKKVLLALSGGSDSSVTAYLLRKATKGKQQLYGVYIRGVDRPDDEAYVRKYFDNQNWITLIVVDATEQFLEGLKGKITMRDKRMAMRGVYKPVIEEVAKRIGASFISQGTLYTDISESGGGYQIGEQKAVIKVHHNTNLGFSLPELTPLDDVVKDSARLIGREIGVPEDLLIRHPFPGPGLVVRIEGEITAEKLAMARQLDDIYIEELRRAKLYHHVWQAGIVITQSIHTCTKGDGATSGALVVYWAVSSVNGFTARSFDFPREFRERLVRRLGNEVSGVGAVAYRESDKPPTTIEWG